MLRCCSMLLRFYYCIDYMNSLSERVLGASESQTLAIAAKAKAMKQQGVDVVSLSTGEPDFATPACAKRAAIEALESDFTHYTESNGIPELRRAVAEKFKRENGIEDASEKTVLVSCGAKHSIMNVLASLLNKGDEVIIPAPYWVSYPAMVQLCEGTPVFVHTTMEQRFVMNAEQLRNAITPNTKCVILNSPSNPTGMMYSRQELAELVAVLEQSDCYIISDEIYEKIIYGDVEHCSIGSFESIAHRVITVNGCSKAYAMTGWRIGFMHAPDKILKEAAKVQSQDTSNPTSIAQKAALSALLYADADVELMRKEFARRRDMICELMQHIPNVTFLKPQGAFYLWVDIRAALTPRVGTAAVFCEELLERYHLALVPGEAFGAEGYVRFSFAANDATIRKGVERFADMITALSQE